MENLADLLYVQNFLITENKKLKARNESLTDTQNHLERQYENFKRVSNREAHELQTKLDNAKRAFHECQDAAKQLILLRGSRTKAAKQDIAKAIVKVHQPLPDVFFKN
jgi:ribosomal protein L9